MGQSTDALMAFGFDLGEELPESFIVDEEDGFEADAFLLHDYDAGIPEWTPEAGPDYWRKKDAVLAGLPVDVITHCSGEYPMYFLAVRGTSCKAHRGYPSEAPQLTVSQQQIDDLRAFCTKHDIEWQEPKWYIFSMWF